MEFKDTIPGIPQQNGCIGQNFAPLFNQVCAMLKSRKFNSFLRNDLWSKAMDISTLLENSIVTPNKDLNQFQHFFEEVFCL